MNSILRLQILADPKTYLTEWIDPNLKDQYGASGGSSSSYYNDFDCHLTALGLQQS